MLSKHQMLFQIMEVLSNFILKHSSDMLKKTFYSVTTIKLSHASTMYYYLKDKPLSLKG